MENRPALSKELDGKSFKDWYWLKEELVSFCRENNLPASGGKEELTDRIAYFLDTGRIKAKTSSVRRSAQVPRIITLESKIEEGFVCTEKHRAFFKEMIGESFSFNVAFQKWLRTSSGKTYADAVVAYCEIKKDSKNKRKDIDKQFEYNTYIRDFFEKNKGRSLDDAISCWKYKKSLPGANAYEDSDLKILEVS